MAGVKDLPWSAAPLDGSPSCDGHILQEGPQLLGPIVLVREGHCHRRPRLFIQKERLPWD